MARNVFVYAVDTKANIEALTVSEGSRAYATDLNKFGTYNGSIWEWDKVVTDIDNTDSPYTALATDKIISCDTDTAAVTINLPAGSANTQYKIQNTGTSENLVTITPNGAENLIGANSSFYLSDGESLEISYTVAKGWY